MMTTETEAHSELLRYLYSVGLSKARVVVEYGDPHYVTGKLMPGLADYHLVLGDTRIASWLGADRLDGLCGLRKRAQEYVVGIVSRAVHK